MSNWTTDSDKWERRDRMRYKNYMALRNYREGRQVDLDDYVDLPKRGTPPEVFYPAVQQYSELFRPTRRDKLDIDKIADFKGLPRDIIKAWQDNRRMKKYFSTEHPRLRYKKCLGWGGNGMAAAFDELDEAGQNVRSVVVKMLFSGDPELMQMETDALRVYRGSEHIVQLLTENDQGSLDSNYNDDDDDDDEESSLSQGNRKRRGKEPAMESKRTRTNQPKLNCFITEMLGNGDLAHFIQRVVQFEERIPNAILWRLFLCLVRMCIGLAYPPSRIDSRKNLPHPIPERIVPEVRPRREVHFDFDPRNIFVGDVIGEGSEHDLTPLLKLGDFGISVEVLPNQSDFYYERLRLRGKIGFLSPEQFCLDWDYIMPDTYTICNHPIAGNFGIHTNIWAVGYVMEDLITLCYPARPPRPMEVTRLPPAGKEKYFTYGAHLGQDRYADVDQDLISLVMRCQAHLPADRPSLGELEQSALHMLTEKGNFGMTDNQILQWVNRILHEPPPNPAGPPPPPPPVEIVGNRPRNPVRPGQRRPLPALPLIPPGQKPQRRPLADRGWRPEPFAYAGGHAHPSGPPPPAIPPLGPFPQNPFLPYPPPLGQNQQGGYPQGPQPGQGYPPGPLPQNPFLPYPPPLGQNQQGGYLQGPQPGQGPPFAQNPFLYPPFGQNQQGGYPQGPSKK